MKKSILAVLAMFLIAGATTQAHRQWLLSSSTILSGESAWITVDSVRSNNIFFANHSAPDLAYHTVYDPDGEKVEIENSVQGKIRSVFDVELKKQGTYRIVYGFSGFSAFWREGEDRRRWFGTEEEFIAEGIKNKPDVRVGKSNATVETYVTLGAPNHTALTPRGEGIELVFEHAHPNDLYAGEESHFVVHQDGKPVAGLSVTIVKDGDRYRDEGGDVEITTDENGKFQFTWPEAGRYWMEIEPARPAGEQGGGPGGGMAELPADAPTIDGVPYRVRAGYTGTFEVLPL